MKRNFLLSLGTFLVLASCITFCKKEPAQPFYYGEWETVTTNGFNWEYRIDAQYMCTKLPEHFGQTEFCNPYTTNVADTLTVQTVERTMYIFEHSGGDKAVLTTIKGDERQVSIIQRK